MTPEQTAEGTAEHGQLEQQRAVGKHMSVLILGDAETPAAAGRGLHERLHEIAVLHA